MTYRNYSSIDKVYSAYKPSELETSTDAADVCDEHHYLYK